MASGRTRPALWRSEHLCPIGPGFSDADVLVDRVHHVGTMAAAVAPAFYHAFGGGLAPGDVFADIAPEVAGFAGAVAGAVAFGVGMVEVVAPLHVFGMRLSGVVESLIYAQGGSGAKPFAVGAVAAFSAEGVDGAKDTAHGRRVNTGT